jgi:hypothetical protein
MADRLLHQCTQPRLHTVVAPLHICKAVLSSSIPKRRMPARTRPGYAPKPPVQQADDAGAVQHLLQP